MNWNQCMVQEFHKKFGRQVRETPTMLEPELRNHRLDLINEELTELEEALVIGDMEDAADALCDLLYVVYGTAVSMGIDIQPLFVIVHEANMRKEGGPTREDGKVLKPDGWIGPQEEIEKELRTQGWKP